MTEDRGDLHTPRASGDVLEVYDALQDALRHAPDLSQPRWAILRLLRKGWHWLSNADRHQFVQVLTAPARDANWAVHIQDFAARRLKCRSAAPAFVLQSKSFVFSKGLQQKRNTGRDCFGALAGNIFTANPEPSVI